MIQIGILKNFDSGTYKAGVQFAGSLTTYFDDINVAKNIPSSALVIGNYVILAIPGGNPKDACVIATWPGGSGEKLGDIGDVSVPSPTNGYVLYWDNATSLWKCKSVLAPSKSRAYRNGNWWVASGAWIRMPLNAVSYDAQGELDVASKLGTADQTEANKLHDADGGFVLGDVGKWVYNTTDYTYTQVTGFVDSGELDLADDIMANGEGYELYAGTFTAKVAGYYPVAGVVRCNWTLADKWYFAGIAKNGTVVSSGGFQSSVGDGVATNCISGIATDLVYLDVGDELSLMAYHNEGNPAQFRGETSQTYLSVYGPV